MSTEIVAEFFWGPIALLFNILEYGFPPESIEGLVETMVSILGTMLWTSIAGVFRSLI